MIEAQAGEQDVEPATINPFATQAIRSGMVPYFFPPGHSLASLVERLRANQWRGQIIGSHGSGKSTLLASLLPEVARQAGEVAVARLFLGRDRLPAEVRMMGRLRRSTSRTRAFLIDGYEQLSPWQRWWLQRGCFRAGVGLVVTAHVPLYGLPVVYRTKVTAETAWRVVTHLLPADGPVLDREQVRLLLEAHAGDLREVLLDLYNWYEEQRYRSPVRPGAGIWRSMFRNSRPSSRKERIFSGGTSVRGR